MPYDYTPNVPQTYQTWTPILRGSTDNPTVTYSKQLGRFWLRDSKFCAFSLTVIATSITKITTSDAMLISLPFFSSNPDPDAVRVIPVRMYSSVLAKTANTAEIGPGSDYLKLTQDGTNIAPIDLTYTLASVAGALGTIKIYANGVYEIA